MEMDCFVVLVFPADKDKSALADLATRFVRELTRACGQAPTMIRPDATALCMLVQGEFKRIDAALIAAAAPDTRYLAARISGPHVAAGLSAAHQWLTHRR